MPDIIELLPDSLANQIAAGEVIQRPASAVKEMLENAIDAGGTQIHLIIRDAGKELIQVIDNGKGMSPSDARLCFERHATSKIKTIEDLFQIRTMGFRGEALASIAAVAQVELKTKTANDEVGTLIIIDNSVVKSQSPCQANTGTSLSVKNLFFNVPARRNFLKSNTTETRHIIDEFTRVAMAYPNIAFRFTNNNTEIFHLEAGNLKQRIVGLLGKNLDAKLVPIEEATEIVNISGFVATPDSSSKTRSLQYFFVNGRFIKSPYLNHAVANAYQHLIAKDEHPGFVLFIDIDPKRIDINVHPTKQEIKFDDEKIVYSFVNAATKHALSKFSIAPSIDFTLHPEIEKLQAISQPFTENKKQHTQNDFLFQSFTEKGKAHFLDRNPKHQNWKELYKIQDAFTLQHEGQSEQEKEQEQLIKTTHEEQFIQINNAYILVTTSNGFMLLDQFLAHQRVLFDSYMLSSKNPITSQHLMIPISIELLPSDAVLFADLLPDLVPLGYNIEHFGQQSFIIQGLPADIPQGQEKQNIEAIIEAVKHEKTELRSNKRDLLYKTIASKKAIFHGKKLKVEEMQELFSKLFQTTQPLIAPNGKKIGKKLTIQDIAVLIQHA
ncbi:MAG: DNA mismatch repair endonuclease MutL [Chitinophagaceae bacterium]